MNSPLAVNEYSGLETAAGYLLEAVPQLPAASTASILRTLLRHRHLDGPMAALLPRFLGAEVVSLNLSGFDPYRGGGGRGGGSVAALVAPLATTPLDLAAVLRCCPNLLRLSLANAPIDEGDVIALCCRRGMTSPPPSSSEKAAAAAAAAAEQVEQAEKAAAEQAAAEKAAPAAAARLLGRQVPTH
jgi:hypothetical protein